jgi:hypothetical protein
MICMVTFGSAVRIGTVSTQKVLSSIQLAQVVALCECAEVVVGGLGLQIAGQRTVTEASHRTASMA